jgi:ABC-type transporter Mla subunit MlaD
MDLKEFWTKTNGWLQRHSLSGAGNYHPEVNEEGLITAESEGSEVDEEKQSEENRQVVVKTVTPADKNQSLEKLQEGFNKLIEQLKGINENLNRQVTQQENLVNQIDKMPQLLESFPAVVENQKQLTEQLLEQLNATATKNQQFIDSIEKIPAETGKQTDALVNIDHQLAAVADTEVQMAENFNKFNQALEKLEQTALGQKDSILQLSKAFTTGDRYLKYMVGRQNKRFIWTFMISMGVCVFAILVLTSIIIYLRP